ncbi:glycosyltransferase family protein [Aureivirga sp. CE67]|uniref:glycosyltransferase family protein n=1 Tax=Aureivirga sp. CE67 TaxID=1788983 RepID=UPI0018CAA09C|nr:glycosyltransferase family protein [Aureivirga sp. CE67]
MKILYAIQGTGNGHLSRAKEVIPALENRADVDILVSGIQADIELPFEVKHKYKGLSFIFGKKGGIDFLNTFKKNNTFRVIKEILSCPVQDYDLVINDFEPISAWACKIRGVNCISLSHQSALLSKYVPKPTHKDWVSNMILKYYAPAIQHFGFHFENYDQNIFLPIIRKGIRQLQPKLGNYYTVYLPAYADKRLIKILSQIKNTNWQVFSKHCSETYEVENLKIQPIEGKAFEKSLSNCQGVLCGAGFETPAETLYLGKKILVIPMKNQYEQHYNAASLKKIGVPVMKKLKQKNIPKIEKWISKNQNIEVHYPDCTQMIIDNILSKYIITNELTNRVLQNSI